MKIALLEDAIRDRIVNSSVLIVCDSYDVMMADSPDRMINTFLASDHCMVWSGEVFCGPPYQPHIDAWPSSPTKLRYLNSGFGIGYKSAFAECLKAMHTIPTEVSSAFPYNDQQLWHELYLRGDQLMHIDTDPRYCLNCHLLGMDDLDMSGDGIRFAPTGSKPMAFHLNGISRHQEIGRAIIRKLGYQ